MKEVFKMRKISYKWTNNEDCNMPNNNYSEEIESICMTPPFDFGDWLENAQVRYEHDEESNKYYVIDWDNTRTGECYWVVSIDEITDIKTARLAVGLTQKQMSEIFEIPKRTIGNWEDGTNQCPIWAKKLILEKLERIKNED